MAMIPSNLGGLPRSKHAALFAKLGWGLLIVWTFWWSLSFALGSMFLGKVTRIPAWSFLGLDFSHNYDASLSWLHGRDPYVYPFGNWAPPFRYPPIVLPMFGWCGWVSFPIAAMIFAGVISTITMIATFLSLHFRRAAGLAGVPGPLALGAVFLSFPVMFELERGNSDVLVLMMLCIAAWAMSRDSDWGWDAAAGIALAIAMWIKIYPALLLVAPLALRRYRVFAGAVLAAGSIYIATADSTATWVVKNNSDSGMTWSMRSGPIQELYGWILGRSPNAAIDLNRFRFDLQCVHSLTTYWPIFWGRVGIAWLARLPQLLGAGAILGLMTVSVSLRIFRARGGGWIVFPYLLWLTLIGTFLMPYSYDYNMICFPLLIVAVYDKRDPRWMRSLVWTAVLWWQPFGLNVPFEGNILIITKFLSLAGVTFCLVQRVRELESPAGTRSSLEKRHFNESTTG
jgi:hypothetical protein